MPKMDSLVGSQAPLTISLVGTPDHNNLRGDLHNSFNNNNSSSSNNNNNSSSPNLNSPNSFNNNNFSPSSRHHNSNSSSPAPLKEVSSKPQYSSPAPPSNPPSSPK